MELVVAPNARKASESLAALDPPIVVPHGTLANWRRDTHSEEYERIAKTYGAEIEKHSVHNALKVSQAAVEVQMLAIERARTELENNRDRQPAQTALNMGKVVQAAQEQHAKLTGKADVVVEFRNADDALDSLMKRLGAIDSTAEETSWTRRKHALLPSAAGLPIIGTPSAGLMTFDPATEETDA